MNKIPYILIVFCTIFISFSIGYKNGQNDTREQYKLNNALLSIINDYYNNDQEIIGDSVVYNHAYWYDCIMETDAYYIADSILQGDWNR